MVFNKKDDSVRVSKALPTICMCISNFSGK